MNDLMERIERELREEREKVHVWVTDDGYLCGSCYPVWLRAEAARQHAEEPDGCDDDGDFAEDIDVYQVGKLREGDLWDYTLPLECAKCGRAIVTTRTEYVYPLEAPDA